MTLENENLPALPHVDAFGTYFLDMIGKATREGIDLQHAAKLDAETKHARALLDVQIPFPACARCGFIASRNDGDVFCPECTDTEEHGADCPCCNDMGEDL